MYWKVTGGLRTTGSMHHLNGQIKIVAFCTVYNVFKTRDVFIDKYYHFRATVNGNFFPRCYTLKTVKFVKLLRFGALTCQILTASRQSASIEVELSKFDMSALQNATV